MSRFVWVCPACGFTSPMLLPHCRGSLEAPHPMAFPVQQEARPNVVPALRVLLDGGVDDPAVIWAAMRPAKDVG